MRKIIIFNILSFIFMFNIGCVSIYLLDRDSNIKQIKQEKFEYKSDIFNKELDFRARFDVYTWDFIHVLQENGDKFYVDLPLPIFSTINDIGFFINMNNYEFSVYGISKNKEPIQLKLYSYTIILKNKKGKIKKKYIELNKNNIFIIGENKKEGIDIKINRQNYIYYADNTIIRKKLNLKKYKNFESSIKVILDIGAKYINKDDVEERENVELVFSYDSKKSEIKYKYSLINWLYQ